MFVYMKPCHPDLEDGVCRSPINVMKEDRAVEEVVAEITHKIRLAGILDKVERAPKPSDQFRG